MSIPSIENCKEELTRIIRFYNTERPHMSIGYKTPETVHTEVGEQKGVGAIHGTDLLPQAADRFS